LSFLTLSGVDSQSFVLVIVAFLLTFILSALIVFTFEKTSRDVVPPDHFLQSLILMALVTTTIMQSIGDSMARGFGIFGALAILRFRSNVGNPRNISFIFAAMAVGIACGVYSFVNATIGTLIFCVMAFVLRLTPFSRQQRLVGQIRFELQTSDQLQRVTALLEQYCRRVVLKRYRPQHTTERGAFIEYMYEVQMDEEQQGPELAEQLRQLEGVNALRVAFVDTYQANND
jgi:uncharacterized membrane protein YhiD involved in acid resistance